MALLSWLAKTKKQKKSWLCPPSLPSQTLNNFNFHLGWEHNVGSTFFFIVSCQLSKTNF
jgi:hypothetical protein